MMLNATEVLMVVAVLGSLSISVGLMFILALASSEISSVNRFIFPGSAMVWSLAMLESIIPESGIGISDKASADFLFISSMALALSFFVFVTQSLHPDSTIAYWSLRGMVPLLSVLAFVAVAAGANSSTNGAIAASPTVNLLYLACVLLLALSIWFALTVDKESATVFALPGMLFVIAYLLMGLEPLAESIIVSLCLFIALLIVAIHTVRSTFRGRTTELQILLQESNRELQMVVADLASQKRISQELQRAVEETDQYKKNFLSNMSHELRTPLNSVIGYSELLESGLYGELNVKQIDRVQKIHQNGQHLLELISDILDLNQLGGRDLKLNVSAFQLRPVVEQILGELNPFIARKGLNCEVQIPDDLPHLFGDMAHVRRLLDNVVENAIKFTPEGNISIRAQAVEVKSGKAANFGLPALGWLRDGAWVVIEVQDSGIGIAPEDQAQIFDEFTQIDSSGSRQQGGTGVGLAITKKLVELHSGAIWLRSAVGQGSTFFVALPADYRAL